MNKGLLFLNIFLALAVIILFILYFNKSTPGKSRTENSPGQVNSSFRIGYFDMDSIEANFTLFKDMQQQIGKMEDSMNNVINGMKNNFQRKYELFQTDRFRYTQEQLDSAGMALTQFDNDIKMRNAEMNQLYQSFYMNKQQEIINYIKKYCLEFNKDGKYSFIIANEPGLVYYKDTTFNITSELLKGLNERYGKKK